MPAARDSSDDPRLEQILDAARTVFLANGYAYMSIDAVAQAAHISKQTIYQLFHDKADIFRRVIECDMERFQDLPDLTQDSRDPEIVLRDVARWLYEHHAMSENISMYQLLIGTAAQFTDLSSAHNDFRIRSTLSWVADYFASLSDKGLIEIDAPEDTARRFAILVTDGSRNLMGHALTDPAERSRFEQMAVALFLRGAARWAG
jgi:AcrR family transcriptional regulator